MQPDQQQRIMGYFIEEAKDHLNTIEQGLLNLQSTIEDPEMVNEVFRAAHSVKGGAAMLGLNAIQRVSHRMEDFFKVLKETPIRVDQKLENLFLRTFDALQELLGQLQGPFGLTEDASNQILANVEPTFEELEQHLNQLAGVPASALPEISISAFTLETPVATGQIDESLEQLFRHEVPLRLREMLQLFKQADEDLVARQQLQELCRSLSNLGEQYQLRPWCYLIDTARRAIADPDNRYRVLAPIVIKDIKLAQELVLAGRAIEIMPCAQLQDLVTATSEPATTVIQDDLASLLASEGITDNLPLDVDSPFDLPFDDLAITASDLELPETLDADLAEAELGRQGPEVGMAELNSLADLFEGELPELGLTWQQEEVLTDDNELLASDLGGESSDDSADFADLLFEETRIPGSEVSSEEDLTDLFGDDLLDDQPTQTAAPTSESGVNEFETNDFADLLDISTPSVPSRDPLDLNLELAALDSDSLFDLSQDEPEFSDDLGLQLTNDLTSDDLGLELPDLSDSNLVPDLNFDSTPEDLTHTELGDLDDLFDGLIEGDLQPTLRQDLSSDSVADPWGDEAAVVSELNLADRGSFDLPDVSIADSAAIDTENTELNPSQFDFDFNDLTSVEPIDAPEAGEAISGDSLGESLPSAMDWEGSLTTDPSESLNLDTDLDTSLFDLGTDAIDQNNSENSPNFEDESLFDALDFGDLSLTTQASDLEQPSNLDLDLAPELESLLEEPTSEPIPDPWSEPSIDAEDHRREASSDFDLDLDFSAEPPSAVEALDLADLDLENLAIADQPASIDQADSPAAETWLQDFTDASVLELSFEETEFEIQSDASVADLFETNTTDSFATSNLDLDDPTELASDPEDLFDTVTQATESQSNQDLEFDVVAVEDLATATAQPELEQSALDSGSFPDLDEFLSNPAIADSDEDAFFAATTAPELSELEGFAANDLRSDELAVPSELEVDVENNLPAAATSATGDFSDLENLLDTAPPTDFADLDGLLDDSTMAPDAIAANSFADLGNPIETPISDPEDFSDLESLLADEGHEEPNLDAPLSGISNESEFDDLTDLLKDAEERMGGSPTVKVGAGMVAPRRTPRPGRIFSEQTMRVPVKHLDNLSNLVGELVVNRNSLEQDQERLRQSLDNLLYQVQQLSDVGQRMQDLYERSLLESSLLASRQGYRSNPLAPRLGDTAVVELDSHATEVEYDPLEMDRFTGFHSLSQEMIELIVRVRESSSDIEFIVDETEQVTRMFRQVTTQLQEGLTRSRMVPFAQTADRLPRAVRDISMKVGKQAELVVEGRETLIDKMILEQLYDPMTHLVNNAITHGIEPPSVRVAAGKPPAGRITIRAFHQGNQTIISVSDDGAGIDIERVKAKAVEKGLISAAEARTISRLDIYDILFHPGFSTKDHADDFSGRGVGMDVVRTSLSEIRGVINTDSTPGKGTTFTIRLPLTLSISKALCCISDRARIAFPMDGVEDMLDVPKDRIQLNSDAQPCIAWRDTILPVRPLADLLGYNRHLSRGNVYGGNQEDDMVSIVVLRSAGNFLALQVDQVMGEQEIVIKQLEGPVPKPVGVAGATVLGDGRIMPIADVLELIDLSMGRIRRDTGGSLWEQDGVTTVAEAPTAKTEPMVLIVDDSITVRELLSMTFNKVGYRVEQARDGQEAWEKLRSGLPCDIVFCDIEMPRMDGLELLSRIQKDPNLKHLPIAMLTSRGADRHRQMAATLGASGYFTKPYLEEALLDAAQRMLKGERLLTE